MQYPRQYVTLYYIWAIGSVYQSDHLKPNKAKDTDIIYILRRQRVHPLPLDLTR
jgi:hypothetical protein